MTRHRSLAVAAFTLFAVAPIAAQATSATAPPGPITQPEVAASAATARDIAPNPSLAPIAANESIGVRANSSAPADGPVTLPRRSDRRNSPALMIVGGAALIIGAVIGDTAGTLIMIGGAAVGLYGLYHYLQ